MSEAGAVVIWQNSNHFLLFQAQKSVFPDVLRSERAAASVCLTQPILGNPSCCIHFPDHTDNNTRSLPLSLSYTHTPIGYVLGQIICLISHPHNPTTSKINQAPQKKKKTNGIRRAWRQEIFKKATVNIQKHIVPTGIWHTAQC